MPTDRAELSSICSTIEQLARRVAEMGESASATKDEDAAAELFAIERALSGAQRRATRLVARSGS